MRGDTKNISIRTLLRIVFYDRIAAGLSRH